MFYIGTYRCRRCGAEFKVCGTSDEDLVSRVNVEISVHGKSTGLMAPTMICTHHCKDGGLGMSDFIGWEVKKD